MYVIEVKSKHNNAILLWYFTNNLKTVCKADLTLCLIGYYQKFNVLCFKVS